MNSVTLGKTHRKVAKVYAKIWEKDIYTGFSKNTSKKTTPLLAELITKIKHNKTINKKVLEIGAGSGTHSLRLGQKKNISVYAVEYSPLAVGEMKKLFEDKANVQAIKADMFDYLLKTSNIYDAVYANAVLHFLDAKSRIKLCRLISRVTAKKGVFALSFKSEGDALEKRGKKVRTTNVGSLIKGDDGITRLFVKDIKPIIQELKVVGFIVKKTFKWNIKGYNIVGEDGKFVGLICNKE